MFALALEGEETEQLVLGDRATSRSAEELTAVWTLLSAWLFFIEVFRIELLLPEESKRRAVIFVGA